MMKTALHVGVSVAATLAVLWVMGSVSATKPIRDSITGAS